MIKIGFIEFPPDAADQVAQCYSTLEAPPEQVSIKNTFVFNEEGKPLRAFSIFEYDDTHAAIADAYLEQRYATFSAIKGLTYSIEHWLSVNDALDILGSGEFAAQFSNPGQIF